MCLCTLLFAFGGMVSSPVGAQSNDILNRLNRLENELETMNRAVYRGEKPPQPLHRAEEARATGTSGNAEIRLQQMERQIRDLTGQSEKQEYELQTLKETLNMLSNRLTLQIEDNQKKALDKNPLAFEIKPPEIKGMKTVLPKGSAETTLYEKSFDLLKNEKFDAAEEGFGNFLEKYPDHTLASNAKYWLGEVYYVQGQYEAAAKVFAQGFQKYPESVKAPDNLLKLGLSLAGMGKVKDACVTLSQVKVKFPKGYNTVVERSEKEKNRLDCGA